VIRVVSRLRALEGDPTYLAAMHASMAQEMMERGRPGCFNQVSVRVCVCVCAWCMLCVCFVHPSLSLSLSPQCAPAPS
jgi:hypothetical protein